VRVLESYCQLATRNKLSVERAMQTFSEMLDQDQDYLPAVLGMATGFMIEKNQVRSTPALCRLEKYFARRCRAKGQLCKLLHFCFTMRRRTSPSFTI
jgi:hypothetical protein